MIQTQGSKYMAINLIDKMHEMYLGDRVTIDITKTLDIILQEQEKNLTDIEKQKLLNYATWFLENIEKDLGIAEKEITEKSRRNTVRQRLLTRSKVTLKGIKQIYCNINFIYIVRCGIFKANVGVKNLHE